MGIEHKHAYRFGFLKSQKWAEIRLEALTRQDACCKLCGVRRMSNDAHHIYYPHDVWATKPKQLIILCRACHELAHVFLNKFSAAEKKLAVESTTKFIKGVRTWVMAMDAQAKEVRKEKMEERRLREMVGDVPRCVCCGSSSCSYHNILKEKYGLHSGGKELRICLRCKNELAASFMFPIKYSNELPLFLVKASRRLRRKILTERTPKDSSPIDSSQVEEGNGLARGS